MAAICGIGCQAPPRACEFARGMLRKMQAARVLRYLFLCFAQAALAGAEPLAIRAMTANLTSDNKQSYSVDNGNHSNPEGAGARILKALKPDVVMIQEFNVSGSPRAWVNQTFGEKFSFVQEEGAQIPNGIISRFPIAESGKWDDPQLDNREFVWARISLPGNRELWAVSVHLHSKGEQSRSTETGALAKLLKDKLPKGALLLIGGDFNTRSTTEHCFDELKGVVVVPEHPPADQLGEISTNAPRNHPYDWVLASEALHKAAVPSKIAGVEFPNGMVFDSRVFTPLDQLAPVRKEDSGVPQMQHMAVVRDFKIP